MSGGLDEPNMSAQIEIFFSPILAKLAGRLEMREDQLCHAMP